MNEEFFKELKVDFAGSLDWKKLRELVCMKMIEADTEEEFAKVIKMLITSMFKSVEELDNARKEFKLEALSDIERKKLEDKFKEANKEKIL